MMRHLRELERLGREPDVRFTFANERTFLAWNRTALALVAGALAANQLVEFESATARILLTLTPIALALGLPILAYHRWLRNERAMRLGKPLPASSIPLVLAIAVVGLALLVAVVGTTAIQS